MLLSGASSCGQFVPSLVCSSLAPRPDSDTSFSKHSGLVSFWNFMHASFIIAFGLLTMSGS